MVEDAMQRARRELPPVVYVPTTAEESTAERRVVLHTVPDGRTALYAYTALDRLRDIYLPDSKWILCDGGALQRIFDATPFDLFFVDVDPGLRDQAADAADQPPEATTVPTAPHVAQAEAMDQEQSTPPTPPAPSQPASPSRFDFLSAGREWPQ